MPSVLLAAPNLIPRVVVLGRIAKVEVPLNVPPKLTSSPVNAVTPKPLAVLPKEMLAVPDESVKAKPAPVTAPFILILALTAEVSITVFAPKVMP